MAILIACCVGGAAYFTVLICAEYSALYRRMLRVDHAGNIQTSSVLMRWTMPLLRPMALPLEQHIPRQLMSWVRDRTDRAAMPQVTAGQLIALSVLLILFVVLCALLWQWQMPMVTILTVCAAAAPWLWLHTEAKACASSVTQDLPAVLDMLVLSLLAGAELGAAIELITKHMHDSALRTAFTDMRRDLSFGMSRPRAWARLRKRAHCEAMYMFVANVLQAHRFGTPLSDVLQCVVEDMRQTRFAQAERSAALVSQKLLAPLLLCFVPAYFLVLFGGLGLMVWQGGGLSMGEL